MGIFCCGSAMCIWRTVQYTDSKVTSTHRSFFSFTYRLINSLQGECSMPKFTYLCHHLGSSGPHTKLAQHNTLALTGSVLRHHAARSYCALLMHVVQPSCSTARHVNLPGLHVYEKGSCHVCNYHKENVGYLTRVCMHLGQILLLYAVCCTCWH